MVTRPEQSPSADDLLARLTDITANLQRYINGRAVELAAPAAEIRGPDYAAAATRLRALLDGPDPDA
jgi:hypothetical protein